LGVGFFGRQGWGIFRCFWGSGFEGVVLLGDGVGWGGRGSFLGVGWIGLRGEAGVGGVFGGRRGSKKIFDSLGGWFFEWVWVGRVGGGGCGKENFFVFWGCSTPFEEKKRF